MIAVVAALGVARAAQSQEFREESGAVRVLLDAERERAVARRAAHRDGLLQQIDAALAHLAAEVKPAVVLLTAGRSSGTGFIVDASGLVVTNAHVADSVGFQGTLGARFPDSTETTGRVVAIGSPGPDGELLAGRDLALVQLVPVQGRSLQAVELGDGAQLKEGHRVAAMGYPLGQPFTITEGSVSGLDFREGVKVKFLQTDAAINPGNSGGPLVAMDGKVVGVNTLIVSPSGSSNGIGYAISVDSVKAFLAQYRAGGPFSEAKSGGRNPRGPTPEPAAAPGRGCPSTDSLGVPWIEDAGAVPALQASRHLASALDATAITLLAVNGESWWVGASRRGSATRDRERDPNCVVIGSAAFYVYGRESDPELDFESTVSGGGEPGLSRRLIELRWYDEADGRKHRWFNLPLAERLGWDTDGRGAPTETPRPVPLPQTINDLL
ncbi:MAG: trypsin-like peptidase domain-containing protein [Elusimicrobia bacterium]|nr:trypsin-like peptidase domain-containing protein [Elusimicrobiota bacterium]